MATRAGPDPALRSVDANPRAPGGSGGQSVCAIDAALGPGGRLGALARLEMMVAMTGFGLPVDVVHIIYTHSKEGDQYERSIESIIIHHSDFLNFEPLKVITHG